MADVNITSAMDVPNKTSPDPINTTIGGIAGLGQMGIDIATSALNVHEARQNRRFQRDMSNTAHQREVKDLYAAGLNPILSARYGGSSTPSGSLSAIQSSQASARGLDAMRLKKDIDVQDSVIRNNNAASALQLYQGFKAQAETAYIKAQTGVIDSESIKRKTSAEWGDILGKDVVPLFRKIPPLWKGLKDSFSGGGYEGGGF